MSLSSLFVHGVSFMMTTEYNELGAVHIADKVIAGIAVEAALAVKGVVGPAASFAEKFGRSSSPRGIDIKMDGTTVELTVRLVVRYGIRIPDVAIEVQQVVKGAVESRCGYEVSAVHIIVQDILYDRPATEEG